MPEARGVRAARHEDRHIAPRLDERMPTDVLLDARPQPSRVHGRILTGTELEERRDVAAALLERALGLREHVVREIREPVSAVDVLARIPVLRVGADGLAVL